VHLQAAAVLEEDTAVQRAVLGAFAALALQSWWATLSWLSWRAVLAGIAWWSVGSWLSWAAWLSIASWRALVSW